MNDTLTDKEIKKLISLGKQIILGLQCDANGMELPCRSDRLASVELMKKYLEIHDYII